MANKQRFALTWFGPADVLIAAHEAGRDIDTGYWRKDYDTAKGLLAKHEDGLRLAMVTAGREYLKQVMERRESDA